MTEVTAPHTRRAALRPESSRWHHLPASRGGFGSPEARLGELHLELTNTARFM